MQYYKDQLILIRQHYLSIKNSLYSELNECPVGKLSCWDDSGKYYYRHNYNVGNGRERKGITGETDLIKQLARKEYVKRVIDHLDESIDLLSDTIDKYHVISRDEIINSMGKAYQSLPKDYFTKRSQAVPENVDPTAIIHDADYLPEIRAKMWAAQPYTKSNYKPEELTQVTSRGELMRSKSEVLIAEQYYSMGIDFRYEAVMKVGRFEFAPDFAFLGKNGEMFYHEHAGMMRDQKYRNRHDWKMARYTEAGIVPWKNLIITYDYDDHINMQEICAIIEGMVKPRLMHYGAKGGEI